MARSNLATQFAGNYGKLLLAVALDPKEVGRRIAEAREAKGWTQLEFATQHANVSPSSVARWEGGKLPPVRELMRIADVLEVSTDSLVELSATGDEREAMRAELAEVRRGLSDLRDVKQRTKRIEDLLHELLGRPPGAVTKA